MHQGLVAYPFMCVCLVWWKAWYGSMVKYRIEIDRGKCTRCGYCYTVDPLHFEPAHKGGRLASFLLSKSKVVNGETNRSKSVGTFDDEKMSASQEAKAICVSSGITITVL